MASPLRHPDQNNLNFHKVQSSEFFLNHLKIEIMETKKQIALDVVNPNAAGIDIGSRSHWVAVGQNAEDVKEFGVYSQDQLDMCTWLQSKNVTSIAMESTGTYCIFR